MPELRPLEALKYSDSAGPAETLLAPPYDVIGEAMAASLRALSPRNAVHLVLPGGTADERYAEAARLLDEWTETGVLVRQPASVYAYRQTFLWPDHTASVARSGFFAEVRLSPFSEGAVLAHEETHAGPKHDRLALTLACRTQLSPVFLIARDPDQRLRAVLESAMAGPPGLQATTEDGVRHEMWRVQDPGLGESLCSAGGADSLLVADGHHRYETALAAAELLSDLVKASYLLCFVVSDADPGLRILPTHRVLSSSPADGEADWISRLAAAFDVEPAPGVDADVRFGSDSAEDSMLVVPAGKPAFRVRVRADACDGIGLSDVSRGIAAVVFDRLVLRPHYGVMADEAGSSGLLSYHRGADEAVAAASEAADGTAFILPPVSLADVWAEARAGRRMPPKTTYFEPKVPSGLLFRPLEERR